MIDPRTEEKALRRLRAIRGQVDGLSRMVEDGQYCIDIVNQVAAVRAALHKVALLVMHRHIESCVADAIEAGDDREEKIEELMTTIDRLGR